MRVQKSDKMGVVGKSYLVLYNVAQFLGWSYMLYLLSPHLRRSLEGGDRGQLYVSIGNTLKLFQTLAVLEILHAAVGLVKSNPLLTGFQVRKSKQCQIINVPGIRHSLKFGNIY